MRVFSLLTAIVLISPLVRGDDMKPDLRTISVSGTGRISAAPNIADIDIGVVTQASTARDALSANNEQMETLHKVLKERGVAAKDIQTTNFNINPQYSQPPVPQPGVPQREFVPKIIGYNVQNSVRITARDLAKFGEVLDAVVTAGANQMHGIRFRIDGNESLLENARKKAMQEAKKKAELMAGEAGVIVGLPISIRDEASPMPPNPQPMMGRAMLSAASVPIASGEQELSVTVHVVYELKTAK